ncbi:MAG: DUF885 domain-containing protein [Bacteroidota bacterium]
MRYKTLKSTTTVILNFFFLLLSVSLHLSAQSTALNTLKTQIAEKWPTINTQLSYESNLAALPEKKEIKENQQYFKQIEKALLAIDTSQLTVSEHLDYEIIFFETYLELEYWSLALAFRMNPHLDVNDNGLTHQYAGKFFYRYYVKKWTGTRMTPDDLFEFGLEEIYQVKAEIKTLRLEMGLDKKAFYEYINEDKFFIQDAKQIADLFEARKKIVTENLGNAFPIDWELPKLKIDRGTDKALASAPGFYRNNTFYYNLFDYPFNIRQLDWLFLHEGNPGHHFESSYTRQLNLPAYRTQFFNAGFAEGWAAYIEYHGEDIGLYETPYDHLGKWEWDIVRSVRIPLDVGINYYGWDDAKALAFWKEHIPNQDEIAQREIDRMRRWPAQVHTYKVGASILQQLRKKEQKRLGKDFDLVAFHKKILDTGRIPIGLLPKAFEL